MATCYAGNITRHTKIRTKATITNKKNPGELLQDQCYADISHIDLDDEYGYHDIHYNSEYHLQYHCNPYTNDCIDYCNEKIDRRSVSFALNLEHFVGPLLNKNSMQNIALVY